MPSSSSMTVVVVEVDDTRSGAPGPRADAVDGAPTTPSRPRSSPGGPGPGRWAGPGRSWVGQLVFKKVIGVHVEEPAEADKPTVVGVGADARELALFREGVGRRGSRRLRCPVALLSSSVAARSHDAGGEVRGQREVVQPRPRGEGDVARRRSGRGQIGARPGAGLGGGWARRPPRRRAGSRTASRQPVSRAIRSGRGAVARRSPPAAVGVVSGLAVSRTSPGGDRRASAAPALAEACFDGARRGRRRAADELASSASSARRGRRDAGPGTPALSGTPPSRRGTATSSEAPTQPRVCAPWIVYVPSASAPVSTLSVSLSPGSAPVASVARVALHEDDVGEHGPCPSPPRRPCTAPTPSSRRRRPEVAAGRDLEALARGRVRRPRRRRRRRRRRGGGGVRRRRRGRDRVSRRREGALRGPRLEDVAARGVGRVVEGRARRDLDGEDGVAVVRVVGDGVLGAVARAGFSGQRLCLRILAADDDRRRLVEGVAREAHLEVVRVVLDERAADVDAADLDDDRVRRRRQGRRGRRRLGRRLGRRRAVADGERLRRRRGRACTRWRGAGSRCARPAGTG